MTDIASCGHQWIIVGPSPTISRSMPILKMLCLWYNMWSEDTVYAEFYIKTCTLYDKGRVIFCCLLSPVIYCSKWSILWKKYTYLYIYSQSIQQKGPCKIVNIFFYKNSCSYWTLLLWPRSTVLWHANITNICINILIVVFDNYDFIIQDLLQN